MGRPEKPIPDAASKELRALAQHLRKLRATAGLEFRAMAAHPDSGRYSAITFQRAASGERIRRKGADGKQIVAGEQIPSEKVVEAFTRVCGGDVEKALKLRMEAARADAWRSVRRAYDRALREGRDAGDPPPRRISPSEVVRLRDLRTAMRYIHLQAGGPSSRELERADPTGHIRHTTLDRVLDHRAKPRLPTPELFEAFLVGCNVAERHRKAWKDAYQRLVDADERLSARADAREARSTSDPDWHTWGLDAQERQERTEEIKQRIGHLVDRDWYDEQLEQERDKEFNEQVAHIDSLTAEDLDQLQREANADLRQVHRQMLADMAKRVRPADRAQPLRAVPKPRRSRP
ncbi:hypothetical protein ACIF6L_31435 [Kitasatospora sp. NPDC086009]|uniref:hypothetical protein n=1 Tax=unclassified Kitasatospora TaxID=2633591 RepID=UPI0037C9BAE1